MAARKARPTVHVIFDTSALFTEAADKLIAEEISEFIISTNSGLELDVCWHLPALVREERRFQMNLEAEKFLPTIREGGEITRS
jgi:hypothetical protein